MNRSWLLGTILMGCFPAFDLDEGLVEHTRVVAVQAQPAEVRPGEQVTWAALVVGPDGTVSSTPQWAWCTTPRSAEERTAVSNLCASGQGLQPVSAEADVPADACQRFGPTPPPSGPDEPARRPVDPDASGGYHQPVAALLNDAPAFGFVRIRCDLPGATREIFEAFEDGYVANNNPVVQALETEQEPDSVRLTAVVNEPEPYVVYLPGDKVVSDVIEQYTATWYTTAGRLSQRQSDVVDGVAQVELVTDGSSAHVWVVVHDDRGGVAWQGVVVP